MAEGHFSKYLIPYTFLFLGSLMIGFIIVISGSFIAKILAEEKPSVPIYRLENTTQYPPVQILIPKLNLSAKIVEMGYDYATNTIQIPDSFEDVGWFKFGAVPGHEGSAILSGHYDTNTGAPGVFYNIDELKQFDNFYIENTKGQWLKYIITEVNAYDLDKFPKELIYNKPDYSQLTLITCSGVWNREKKIYSKRLAVFARQDPGFIHPQQEQIPQFPIETKRFK